MVGVMPERSYACNFNVEFKVISKVPGFAVLVQTIHHCKKQNLYLSGKLSTVQNTG